MSSRAPAPPKPPVSLSPSVTISEQASLVGTHTIQIQSGTVIHPRAKILSNHTAVTIGSGCSLSSKSSVGLLAAPTVTGPSEDAPSKVSIGSYVSIAPLAVVEATSVGDGTIIEGAAKVGPGAVIGQHCRIGPHCTVPAGEVLEDFTVIYGENLRRTDVAGKMMMDANLRNLRKQVETMRRLIPSKPEKFM